MRLRLGASADRVRNVHARSWTRGATMNRVAIDFIWRKSQVLRLALLMIGALAITSIAAAQTEPPKADKPGSADDPMLKRYSGSIIIIHQKQAFNDFVLPLGKLEPA